MIHVGKDAFYKRNKSMKGKLNKILKKRIMKSINIDCGVMRIESMDHEDGQHQMNGSISDTDTVKDGNSVLDGIKKLLRDSLLKWWKKNIPDRRIREDDDDEQEVSQGGVQ